MNVEELRKITIIAKERVKKEEEAKLAWCARPFVDICRQNIIAAANKGKGLIKLEVTKDTFFRKLLAEAGANQQPDEFYSHCTDKDIVAGISIALGKEGFEIRRCNSDYPCIYVRWSE